MPDLGKGLLRWQEPALGLALGGSRRRGFQRLEMRLDSRDIGFGHVAQQLICNTLTNIALRWPSL
jgi:hypothetical protein